MHRAIPRTSRSLESSHAVPGKAPSNPSMHYTYIRKTTACAKHLRRTKDSKQRYAVEGIFWSACVLTFRGTTAALDSCLPFPHSAPRCKPGSPEEGTPFWGSPCLVGTRQTGSPRHRCTTGPQGTGFLYDGFWWKWPNS